MFRAINERKMTHTWDQYNMVLQCTHRVFYEHLEFMFEPGMTWDNYGEKPEEWAIEYIVPLGFYQDNLKMFTYKTNYGNVMLSIEDMCMYDNVRPIWNKDSTQKRGALQPVPSDDEVMNVCNHIIQHKRMMVSSYCSSSSLSSVCEE